MLYGVPLLLYVGGFAATALAVPYYNPLYRHGTPWLGVPLNFFLPGLLIWAVVCLYYLGLAAAYREKIVLWPWQRREQPSIIPWHILLIIALIGSLFLGSGISRYLNSHDDPGPVRSFTATVIEREARYRRRSGMHYELRLATAQQPDSLLIMPVGEAPYHAYPEGTRLTVHTKPGRLGQEWVVGMRVMGAG